MARTKKVVEASSEDVNPPEAATNNAPVPASTSKKAKQTSFDVLNKNEVVVRTYTLQDHGADAEDLATGYAKKIGGTVK
jgi:hypothetical protein